MPHSDACMLCYVHRPLNDERKHVVFPRIFLVGFIDRRVRFPRIIELSIGGPSGHASPVPREFSGKE